MVDQLYAVLVPLENDVLLLPNISIAEVLSHDSMEPLDTDASAPVWQLGWVMYEGERVPVVSCEGIAGAPLPPPNRRARLAVINGLGSSTLRRFAILTQGHPHLFTVNRSALQPTALRDSDDPQTLVARVRIASREAVIPDIEAFTRRVSDAHAAQVPMSPTADAPDVYSPPDSDT